MPTLVSNFASTAENLPNQTALVFNQKKIDYGQLNEAIKRFAKGLLDLGIVKGDRIALMMPNVPHFCISYYAILQIGAVVVPINIMYNKKEIQYHLQDCGVKLVIAWSGFSSEVLPAVQATASCQDVLFLGQKIPQGTKALTQIIAQAEPLSEEIDISPTDLAVINYTSGIANEALGSELTHEALVTNAITCHRMFHISPNDNIISVLPLFHPLGQTLLMNSSFFVGASVILLPKFDPQELIKLIEDYKASFLAAVPDMYRSLSQLTGLSNPVPTLRYCLSYGGRLSSEMISIFESKFDAVILEAYGLTEAAPLVTCNRINHDKKPGSVGPPLVGVEIQIRGHNGQVQKPLMSGEIWIKSSSVMQGYHNHPDETRKKLKDGWLFSGDMGYVDEDNFLFILARKEDIITKGGFEILPHVVEGIILEHSNVEEVAIIAIPDKIHGSEVKAFIVTKDGKPINYDDLFKFCQNSLPIYKIPKYVEFCENLPKSATGRVLKRNLRIDSVKTKSN